MQAPRSVGVVGLGYWGPNLVRNFHALTDCRVHAVCDTAQDRLDHLGRLYPGVKLTRDFAALLEDPDVDAIAIATPTSTHFGLAKACLQAGKHVMIEKPMASSVAQCRELNALAAAAKLTLMVGHTFVYSSPVRMIKKILESGDLGEIRYINSQRLNLGLFQKDINVAWDLAPHDIAIILFFAPELPIAVNCQGKAHVTPGIEDVTSMSVDFPNGTFATIQSSWLDPNKVRQMTIVGSHKMIVYDDTAPLEKIRIFDKRVTAPPHYDTYADFHFSYHYGDVHSPHIAQVEPLKVECQHFIDCIRSGAKPDSSGLEGLQVIQVLEAASQSLKNGGGRVPITY
jgi:predicted dehydrogenase